jgi:GNAT superfamily N-acetyltransferase
VSASGDVIRPARIDEAALLHALTARSTLSWGYEPAFLDWEPGAIAVTPAFLRASITHVLERDGVIAGYSALLRKDDGLYLDKLFVDPPFLRTGAGTRLWRHAVHTARELGAGELLLDADPNAAPFYRAMGAEWLREIETSWPGWRLQVFRFQVPTKGS